LARASDKGIDDHYLAEMDKRRAEDAQREFEERQKRMQSNYEARRFLGSISTMLSFFASTFLTHILSRNAN
jgi:hypothetical protein